jgi:DNA invertase Pin-like site-specific DNA recombinase
MARTTPVSAAPARAAPLAPARPRRPDPLPTALPPPAPPRRQRRGGGCQGGVSATAAVAYLRRSTDRQEQSIPDQLKVIERFAAERGLTILRSYTDDAISGTSAAGRKAFQQLIADAQSPSRDFGFVVVYDVKRFGRVGNDEAGYYRHLLTTAGVEVLYASEGFNGGETDDLLRPVKQWQARQESKDLSKVTIRGLLSRSEGGWWMGGVPPHGYDLRYENDRGEFLFILRHNPDGTKSVLDEKGKLVRTLARGESMSTTKRDRAKLVPGEESRVKTIRKIFDLYIKEGKGLKAIADTLNRAGTPTPRGSAWSHIYAGQWRDSTVRAILVNPIYAGDMVWNRRTDARFHMISGGRAVERAHPHGARLVPNDEADWIIVPNTHKGLVGRKAFEAAKGIRMGRPVCANQIGVSKPKGGWTGARSRFILSGLVRCSICGGRYQGVTRQKGKLERDGIRIKTYSYACGSYIAKGTSVCSFNPVGQEVLEDLVIDAVLGHYAKYQGKGGHRVLTEEVRKSIGTEASDLRDARTRLERERATAEKTIAAILDNSTPGTRDLAEGRLETLRRQRQELERRAGELERLALEERQVQDAVAEVGGFLAGLEFMLRHGTGEEKMPALRKCVQTVTVEKVSRRVLIGVADLPGFAAMKLVVARIPQLV